MNQVISNTVFFLIIPVLGVFGHGLEDFLIRLPWVSWGIIYFGKASKKKINREVDNHTCF